MPDRLFAIGDIHGCFDPFQELVENQIRLTQSDTLVLLGDYIDRGPKVKAVVDYILELQRKGFHVVTLMGNHEDMLLNAWDHKRHLPIWLFNGGDKTMQSFGIRSIKKIGTKYLDFFSNLDLWYGTKDYLFVHAGFNDDISNPFEDEYSMIWQCRTSYSHPRLKDKVIVHGHCITTAKELEKQIAVAPQVISADTGCVYNNIPGYNQLTAIELNKRELFSIKCNCRA